MKIRTASKQDLPTILEIQKKAFLSEAERYNDFSIPPLHQTIVELEIEFLEKTIAVAYIEETIVGSVRFFTKDNVGYIGKLIVSPEHQNKGIGRSLMKYAESQFTSISKIEIFTGEKSEKNIQLYKSLGYEILNVVFETENVNLVVMVKTVI